MEVDAKAVPAPGAEAQLHSPPQSNKDSPTATKLDGSDSELSDLEEEEEDIGIVRPDSYSDDGVPIFRPTMAQFKSFKLYMDKINPWGMKSGIVKVIPPPEWKANQPRLDEAIKTVRVKEPIKQDIMGTSGTYRQANILHQRSYNLPQWRQLCEQSEHQPPAKRGERRANQEKDTRSTRKSTGATTGSKRKAPARGAKGKAKTATVEGEDGQSSADRLPTPDSTKADDDTDSFKQEMDDEDGTPKPKGGRQPKAISVSSRRKYNRRDAAAKIDEEAFKNFKYELEGADYSKERCEELERAYWKTLTYAPPLYGADMPGSLFDDQTTTWNLGRLENLLDVLGTKIPGVNTAYLYLGMWKATFAWHLEDVDLYSINYLHFGAPKQWYSISQGDARRFEAAMSSIWPADAKACDQFLRHKTFLISPSHLLQNYNIKVNKIVHHPGEFVITFPYGYHSGYNLGYNCAEAVNFALDSWMEFGRVAKKCDCSQAQDSVWIDIREIERKLRGEDTEFEETDEEEEEEEDDETLPTDLSTTLGGIKPKAINRKRKRLVNEKGVGTSSIKRIRVRIKAPAREPCSLCPNDIPSEPLLPTEDGQQAHRLCALYIPETSIESGETEKVVDIRYINKARLELKCNYCRSKKGACFQCSQKKCTRAYHPTCAAAAGVLVEQGETPIFGEDGTEYKEWGIEFSCRFHRGKRDKKYDSDALSDDNRIRKAAAVLKVGDTCQLQYYKGDIFAGAVVENRASEEMLLVDILPRGERVEVEYKWLLIPDPADFKLAKPSANAIPMPKSRFAKESLNTTKRLANDTPRAEDKFGDDFTWAQFHSENIPRNKYQVKIDLKKENQVWYYLGKTSTEARAQFTEDPRIQRHNPKGHFLDTIPRAVISAPRQSYAASYPTPNISHSTSNVSRPSPLSQQAQSYSKPLSAISTRLEKPYVYKPRNNAEPYRIDPQAYQSQQNFLQHSAPYNFGTDPRYQTAQSPTTPVAQYAGYSPNSTHQSHRPAQPQLPQQVSQSQKPQQFHQQHQQVGQPQRPQQQVQQPQQVGQPQSSQQQVQQPRQVQQLQQIQRPQQLQQPQQIRQPQQVQQPRQVHNAQQAQKPQVPPQSQRPQLSQQSQHYRPPGQGPLAPPPAYYRQPYTAPTDLNVMQPPKQNNPFNGRTQSSRPNPFAKYTYLQREHNRSPLEYKSPYRPGGGFMNGYQGNLEKHLQQSMFKNRSASGGSLSAPSLNGSNRAYTPSHPSSTPPYSSTPPTPSSYGMPATPNQQPTTSPSATQPKTSASNAWEKKGGAQLHPAIRQQYSSMFNNNNHYQPPRSDYIPPPSVQSASSPAYQMQRSAPQQSPLIPPPQYYQQPYVPSPSMSKNVSPITPTFSTNRQQPYPTPSHPHTYQQPQYHSHSKPKSQSQHQNENKSIYAHQQYFQKPQAQTQTPMVQPTAPILALPQAQAQPTAKAPYTDLPDVPVDSTSIIENMMMNLRKARASGI